MSETKRPNNSELLQKIVNDMAEIKTDLAVIKRDVSSHADMVIDHEARIRELEKRGYQSQWVIALFTAVVTAAAVLALSNFIQF